MDTTDTDGICGERPGSTISSALLLRGRSLQAWTRQGTALSKGSFAVCWFVFSPSSLITIVQVKNFQGLSVCWINELQFISSKTWQVPRCFWKKKKKGDQAWVVWAVWQLWLCLQILAPFTPYFSSQSSFILILTKENVSPQASETHFGDLALILHSTFEGFTREAEYVSVVKASSNSFTSWLVSSGYRAVSHFSCVWAE